MTLVAPVTEVISLLQANIGMRIPHLLSTFLAVQDSLITLQFKAMQPDISGMSYPSQPTTKHLPSYCQILRIQTYTNAIRIHKVE
jgi:hypothetical protein